MPAVRLLRYLYRKYLFSTTVSLLWEVHLRLRLSVKQWFATNKADLRTPIFWNTDVGLDHPVV